MAKFGPESCPKTTFVYIRPSNEPLNVLFLTTMVSVFSVLSEILEAMISVNDDKSVSKKIGAER